MSEGKEKQKASAWLDIPRFLAGTLYEPEEVFIEEDLFGNLIFVAQKSSDELGREAERLKEVFIAESHPENLLDMSTLLVDYSRLFLGPQSLLAPPYFSWWLSEMDQDRVARQRELLDFYTKAGLEVVNDFQDQPDHAAVILEVLYILRAQKSEISTLFFEQYVRSWMPKWAKTLEKQAQTRTYQKLGAFIQHWLLSSQ